MAVTQRAAARAAPGCELTFKAATSAAAARCNCLVSLVLASTTYGCVTLLTRQPRQQNKHLCCLKAPMCLAALQTAARRTRLEHCTCTRKADVSIRGGGEGAGVERLLGLHGAAPASKQRPCSCSWRHAPSPSAAACSSEWATACAAAAAGGGCSRRSKGCCVLVGQAYGGCSSGGAASCRREAGRSSCGLQLQGDEAGAVRR